ncbi:predicted protein [Streptomyces sp. SPB78]|nr:predicted protein [Streptomyces sp. SPB78]
MTRRTPSHDRVIRAEAPERPRQRAGRPAPRTGPLTRPGGRSRAPRRVLPWLPHGPVPLGPARLGSERGAVCTAA